MSELYEMGDPLTFHVSLDIEFRFAPVISYFSDDIYYTHLLSSWPQFTKQIQGCNLTRNFYEISLVIVL